MASEAGKKKTSAAARKTRPRSGPSLAAALICERALQEKKDGSLSLIRVVDQIILDVPPAEPNVVHIAAPITLALVVAIREGKPDHEYELSITTMTPDGGSQALTPTMKATTGGVVSGVNFIAEMRLAPQPSQVGTYYFEVALDGVFLSRIPLVVSRREAPVPDSGP